MPSQAVLPMRSTYYQVIPIGKFIRSMRVYSQNLINAAANGSGAASLFMKSVRQSAKAPELTDDLSAA